MKDFKIKFLDIKYTLQDFLIKKLINDSPLMRELDGIYLWEFRSLEFWRKPYNTFTVTLGTKNDALTCCYAFGEREAENLEMLYNGIKNHFYKSLFDFKSRGTKGENYGRSKN